MSTDTVAPPLGPLYGSIFFSTIMSTAFYGVTCMQTFFYYVHYVNDPLRTKILVAILWLVNTMHEAFCVAGAYKYIIAGLLNPFSFMTGEPELVLLSLLTAMAAVPTQGFLIYRIYAFSGKSIILPLIWFVLAPVELVCSTIYIIEALYTVNGVVRVIDISILNSGPAMTQAALALSSTAAADVLIAVSMTFLLIRQQSAIKSTSTAHVMQRLIVFSVNTGTWTATFALLTIILLHLFPSNWIYSVFIFPLCPVYCNTLLANLNARAYVLGAETTHNIDLDLFSGRSSRTSDQSRGDNPHGESKIVFGANPELCTTMEVTTFPDMHPSTTQTSV